MTRREFFRRLFPSRDSAPSSETVAAGPPGEACQRELFMEAMRLGIDPATVDPGRLRRLLARGDPAPLTNHG